MKPHEITIQQLGGYNRLQAMIGASNFVYSEKDNYISFRFKRILKNIKI